MKIIDPSARQCTKRSRARNCRRVRSAQQSWHGRGGGRRLPIILRSCRCRRSAGSRLHRSLTVLAQYNCGAKSPCDRERPWRPCASGEAVWCAREAETVAGSGSAGNAENGSAAGARNGGCAEQRIGANHHCPGEHATAGLSVVVRLRAVLVGLSPDAVQLQIMPVASGPAVQGLVMQLVGATEMLRKLLNRVLAAAAEGVSMLRETERDWLLARAVVAVAVGFGAMIAAE
jgi:hypothetical protein